jgi:hypothetical protein
MRETRTGRLFRLEHHQLAAAADAAGAVGVLQRLALPAASRSSIVFQGIRAHQRMPIV